MNISRFSHIFLTLFVIASGQLFAQQAAQLRLNEVMTLNVHNYQDSYGNHKPWIEIYNSSAATVDIKGCYLTDDLSKLKKYMIPKGDVMTAIKPHQHLLFWADNDPYKGTFHLNFTLDPEVSTIIALVDADGRTIIDSIRIPAGIPADCSYGRLIDGVGEIGDASAWDILPKVTPSTNNIILDSNAKLDRLKESDPLGGIMTLTAMMVVFFGLLVLSFVFWLIGSLSIRISNRRAIEAGAGLRMRSATRAGISGEVTAAICMAVSESQNDVHDIENAILTIRRVERKYSPWSSKIYGLRSPIERHMFTSKHDRQ